MVHYHVSAKFVSFMIDLLTRRPSTVHSWASPRTSFSAVGSIITSTRPEVGTFCRTRKRSEMCPIFLGIGCEGSSTLYKAVVQEEDIVQCKL